MLIDAIIGVVIALVVVTIIAVDDAVVVWIEEIVVDVIGAIWLRPLIGAPEDVWVLKSGVLMSETI